MSKRPLVVGNWKMNLGHAAAHELAWNCDQIAYENASVEVAILPGLLYVGELARLAAVDGALKVGAQDCDYHLDGAFTGDVSAHQLVASGVGLVLLGHSERRTYHGESDSIVGRKLLAAVGVGLSVILCVGETEQERTAGRADEILSHQLGVLAQFPQSAPRPAVDVAYEPVWAIGSGVSASDVQIESAHGRIRAELDRMGFASSRILYGGSVSPENAPTLARVRGVDGFLVGGSSLDVDSFSRIVKTVADSRQP